MEAKEEMLLKLRHFLNDVFSRFVKKNASLAGNEKPLNSP